MSKAQIFVAILIAIVLIVQALYLIHKHYKTEEWLRIYNFIQDAIVTDAPGYIKAQLMSKFNLTAFEAQRCVENFYKGQEWFQNNIKY